MSAAVLHLPPMPAPPPARAEGTVRAYRLDWTFDSLQDDQLPESLTREDLDRLEETVYYAAKYRDQAFDHADRRLREVPGSDVTIQLVEVPADEWLDSFLGEPDEVSGR